MGTPPAPAPGDPAANDGAEAAAPPIPFREALGTWTRIALLSFGGPAGQIAVMHRILVDEKRWLGERRFLHALNYCMLLPGPEAQQLVTYVGWLTHGWRGGLVAGLLFVLPGFLSILALSALYAGFQGLGAVDALFFGLKPAVMAVVLQALLRIGSRALRGRWMAGVAALSFVAIFFLQVPFPLIIVGAALLGLLGARLGWVRARGADDDAADADRLPPPRRRCLRGTVGVAALWLAIWLLPLAALAAALGPDDVFVQVGRFFATAAAVTFGGAYSVLAFVAQQAVEVHRWLQPGEMLDGLGMAETTPGPLIQVVQFVGYLAAYREATGMHPALAGALASLLVTWVTFAPCFLWIFVGAPYIEALRGNRALDGALTAVTAAVVGVVANLTLWFAVHVLFAEVGERRVGPLRLLVPDLASVDLASVALALAAGVAMLRFHVGMMTTLAASVLVGGAWKLLTG